MVDPAEFTVFAIYMVSAVIYFYYECESVLVTGNDYGQPLVMYIEDITITANEHYSTFAPTHSLSRI